ncbi:MAG: F0F1 ATP synthase subunit alpha, partial [Candidatus Omnitrophica bacterium]|nr:F0F1 ATP synthase subunit alpha [Candidatus Omnitrophota bacterium]
MDIRPEEVTAVIKKAFEQYRTRLKTESTGRIIQVGDAIVRIYGLDDVMMGEVLDFGNNVYGIVLNLEEDSVGAVILGTENPDRDI